MTRYGHHCTRCCPTQWQGFDPVRTPADLRAVRTLLYIVAALLLLLGVLVTGAVGWDGVGFGLWFLGALVTYAAHGQTVILRNLHDHTRGRR